MNIKRLLLSLLVLCVTAISCRKDTYRNEVNTKEEKTTIKSYRSYFYNVVRKQQQAAVMKGNILSSGSKDIKVYPNWEKATLSETDKYELLEVPIFHGNEGFLLYNFEKKGKKSTVIDETVIHSVFKRLVMYKNKAGVIKERILTYIPDKTYLEKNGPDISHNRINRLDKNFSGYIEYSDINKNRLFVLLLKDGKAVFKKQFRNEKVTKGKSAGVMDYWVCDEECYDYWEWQCAGTADDPTEYGCTDPEITDSWCEPVYCDDGLGGGEEEEDPCLDPANMNTGWCDDEDGGGGNPPPLRIFL